MYAKIVEGSIETVRQRPDWRNDDGTPVSDATLIENGYYPVVDSPPALFNRDTQWLERLPQDQWHVKADRVEVAYKVTDKGANKVLKERVQGLERKRRDLEGSSTTLTLKSGREITIPLTGEAQALLTAAERRGGRNPNKTMPVRGAKGWMDLNASEAGDAFDQAADRIAALRNNQRTHENALQAIYEDTNLTDQEKAQRMAAYDDETENGGWSQ